MPPVIKCGYDKDEIHTICKLSKNTQTRKDYSYMELVMYRQPDKQYYAEYIPGIACIFGYVNPSKSELRIICTAVADEHKRHGYGGFLLRRAINYAKRAGLNQISTRTTSGYEFYSRYGFFANDRAENGDYMMHKQI